MDVSKEPAVRGRLNQLVQMFENQSKSKTASTTERAPAKKLSRSKLTAVHRQERPKSRRVLPSSSSVGTLIRTFNAVRPESPLPVTKSSTKKWNRERLHREERIPEVASMVDEIFLGLGYRPSIESQRTPDNLFDETESLSDVSYTSTESNGDCIGAMWSEVDDVKDEIRRLWSKKLQDAVAKYGTSDGCLETWKASMAWLDSNVEGVEGVEGVEEKGDHCSKVSDMSSVRTYKALIEMTVCVGEYVKPTINVINRHPSLPSTDLDEVILSIDHL